MDMLGYLTVYIRIESEELETSYIKMHSDFRKPITRRIMRRLLKSAKETAISMGLTTTKVCFASEEEYEKSETVDVWKNEWLQSEAE